MYAKLLYRPPRAHRYLRLGRHRSQQPDRGRDSQAAACTTVARTRLRIAYRVIAEGHRWCRKYEADGGN
jgi:hypothetical protein